MNISRTLLAQAYDKNEAGVRRLATWIGVTGPGLVDAIDQKLWELAFCSAEARFEEAERRAM